MSLPIVVSLLTLYRLSLATTTLNTVSYSLDTTWQGNDFYDNFYWWEWDDPTHGRVNYVDQATSKAKNLTWADHNKFIMRADSWSNSTSSVKGRDSIRIHSDQTFTDGVLVLDVEHMPTGCGTWPAFWTCTKGSWPVGGEIDVIEGINGEGTNLVSLHTDANCSMPNATSTMLSQRWMNGKVGSNDCVSGSGTDNSGCGANDERVKSFGPAFNRNEGGYYVMRRDSLRGISVWFWPRNDLSLPIDIESGSLIIFESLWGEPVVTFPNTKQCDMKSHFDNHEIIFDLTFCGDWAGSVWSSTACGSKTPSLTCDEYVDTHPEEFADAYWEINSLRWYTISTGSSVVV